MMSLLTNLLDSYAKLFTSSSKVVKPTNFFLNCQEGNGAFLPELSLVHNNEENDTFEKDLSQFALWRIGDKYWGKTYSSKLEGENNPDRAAHYCAANADCDGFCIRHNSGKSALRMDASNIDPDGGNSDVPIEWNSEVRFYSKDDLSSEDFLLEQPKDSGNNGRIICYSRYIPAPVSYLTNLHDREEVSSELAEINVEEESRMTPKQLAQRRAAKLARDVGNSLSTAPQDQAYLMEPTRMVLKRRSNIQGGEDDLKEDGSTEAISLPVMNGNGYFESKDKKASLDFYRRRKPVKISYLPEQKEEGDNGENDESSKDGNGESDETSIEAQEKKINEKAKKEEKSIEGMKGKGDDDDKNDDKNEDEDNEDENNEKKEDEKNPEDTSKDDEEETIPAAPIRPQIFRKDLIIPELEYISQDQTAWVDENEGLTEEEIAHNDAEKIKNMNEHVIEANDHALQKFLSSTCSNHNWTNGLNKYNQPSVTNPHSCQAFCYNKISKIAHFYSGIYKNPPFERANEVLYEREPDSVLKEDIDTAEGPFEEWKCFTLNPEPHLKAADIAFRQNKLTKWRILKEKQCAGDIEIRNHFSEDHQMGEDSVSSILYNHGITSNQASKDCVQDPRSPYCLECVKSDISNQKLKKLPNTLVLPNTYNIGELSRKLSKIRMTAMVQTMNDGQNPSKNPLAPSSLKSRLVATTTNENRNTLSKLSVCSKYLEDFSRKQVIPLLDDKMQKRLCKKGSIKSLIKVSGGQEEVSGGQEDEEWWRCCEGKVNVSLSGSLVDPTTLFPAHLKKGGPFLCQPLQLLNDQETCLTRVRKEAASQARVSSMEFFKNRNEIRDRMIANEDICLRPCFASPSTDDTKAVSCEKVGEEGQLLVESGDAKNIVKTKVVYL